MVNFKRNLFPNMGRPTARLRGPTTSQIPNIYIDFSRSLQIRWNREVWIDDLGDISKIRYPTRTSRPQKKGEGGVVYPHYGMSNVYKFDAHSIDGVCFTISKNFAPI